MYHPLPDIAKFGAGLLLSVADRAKQARLAKGWSREALAEQSQVNVWSIRRFESTGNIAFVSLVKIAEALGRSKEIDALFQPDLQPKSMAELEKTFAKPRKRGRSSR